MKHMKKLGRFQPPTVAGKAEAVLPDAYQQRGGHLDAVVNIRRGLSQAREGLGRSVHDVFEELERQDLIR